MPNLRLAAARRASEQAGRLNDARPSTTLRGPKSGDGGGGLFSLGDTLAAPFRGIEGAAQDVYGFADMVTGGALPDWDKRMLGESRTTVGGVVEGISNFMVGFIPVAGQIGKAGKLARLAKLGGLSKKAQATAKAAGKGGKAVAIEIGRTTIAGAVADALVWDGHEARLSDFLNEVPGIQGAVTEYLSSNEDDSELEGRLKNVLEGAAMGAMLDSLFLGIKKLRVYKKAIDEGDDATKAAAKAEEAVPVKEIEEAHAQGLADEGRTDDPRTDRREPVDPEDPNAPKDPEDPNAPKGPEVDEATRAAEKARTEAEAVPEFTTVPGTKEHSRALMKALGASEATADRFHAELMAQTDTLLDTGTLKVNPRDLEPDELLARMLRPEDLNLAHMDGPEGAMAAIRAADAMTEHMVAAMGPATFKKTTWVKQRTQATRQLADMVGKTEEHTAAAMTAAVKNAEYSGIAAHNYSVILQAKAVEMDEGWRIVMDPNSTEAEQLKAMAQTTERLESFLALQAGVKGLKSQMGRAFNFLKDQIPVRQLPDLDAIRARVELLGGPDEARKLAEKLRMAYGEGGVAGTTAAAKLSRGLQGSKGLRLFNEYWINSLLSGGRTIMVNLLSGLTMGIYRPIETMMGATVEAGLAGIKGDHAAVLLQQEVIRRMAGDITGLFTEFGDAMKMARVAFREGNQFLDPFARTVDVPDFGREFSASGFGVDPTTATGKAAEWFGKVVNFPTRLLGASDEGMKQLNYRASFRSALIEKGMADGLDSGAAAIRAHDEMEKVLLKGQSYGTEQLAKSGWEEARAKGLNDEDGLAYVADFVRKRSSPELSAIHTEALSVAREVTFTTPLRPGSLSRRLQQAVIAHPALRLIMPFVRTPINIATFAAQRLDVAGVVDGFTKSRFPEGKFPSLSGQHNKMVRQMTSGNTRDRAEATGRIMAGMGAVTFFGTMAVTGKITGRGPSDIEQRRVMESAGWLPYSIKIGEPGNETYIQYARLDPFATMIGMAADIIEYGKYTGEEDLDASNQLVLGLLSATANNFTNKTYLTGLSRFVEVLQEPDTKIESFLRAFGGSLVPSALNQSLPMFQGDSVMRDVNSMYDAAAKKVPGLSADLAPVRNILGEPVHLARSAFGNETGGITDFLLPVAYRTVKDSVVDAELMALKHGFSPPKKARLGLELTEIVNTPGGQSAYDKWSQLHGEVKLGRQNLRTSLRELIKSPRYQRMPVDTDSSLESPRIAAVNRILMAYRAAAWDTMLRDYPQLAQHEKLWSINKGRLAAGVNVLEMLES